MTTHPLNTPAWRDFYTAHQHQLHDLPLDDLDAATADIARWLKDEYFGQPESRPPLSPLSPGEIARRLPESAPEKPEDLTSIFDDVKTLLLDGITHTQHPHYYAYFSNTASVPGLVSDLLTSGLNVNTMLWRTSPAATELEQVVMGWLAKEFSIPGWFGMTSDSASTACVQLLAAAREKAVPGLRQKGLAALAKPLRVYVSEHTHSSLARAAVTVGIGEDNVVVIPCDDDYAMKPEALQAAISADRAASYTPTLVCATIGTTSCASIDPLAAIADITQREQLWLHVDGAYGGVVGLLPECQHWLNGIERADSYVVNPHKWLFTPIDLSLVFCRHPEALEDTFSMVPEYLRNRESQQTGVIDFMNYGFHLGRRWRALKLWYTLRAYGLEGIRDRLRLHRAMAMAFASWMDAHPDFETLAPTHLSLVSFRARPATMAHDEGALNDFNERLMNTLNDSGSLFLSHTRLNGRYTLRLALGNLLTTPDDLETAWAQIQQTAASLGTSQADAAIV